MKATVIYGFLGAGKTTLLRRLVPRLLSLGKTALLVNDFGKEGIDQIVLQTDDLTVRQVVGGCICCEVRGDLVNALKQIHESVRPDRLVIEPTGLAAPDILEQVFATSPVQDILQVDSVITVLDAARFEAARQALGDFYPQQIRAAGVVLINKADLATAGQIGVARDWARSLNPAAALVTTTYCDVEPDLIAVAIHNNHARATSDHPGAAQNSTSRHEPDGSHAAQQPDAELSTLGLERGVVRPCQTSREGLERWLRALASGAFGEVVRAKGFVPLTQGTVLVDVVLGDTEIRPFDDAPARIDVIGRNLRITDMEQALTNGSTQITRSRRSSAD